MIQSLFTKVLTGIVWAYLIVVPVYVQAMTPPVAARAGIIWIALALAVMYEYRNVKQADIPCWANLCSWKFFRNLEDIEHEQEQAIEQTTNASTTPINKN